MGAGSFWIFVVGVFILFALLLVGCLPPECHNGTVAGHHWSDWENVNEGKQERFCTICNWRQER